MIKTVRAPPHSILTKVRIFVGLLFLSCTPTHAAEFRDMTLALVSPNLNTQLLIVVARQAVFFKDEDLNVHDVTLASGGTLMMANLAIGRISPPYSRHWKSKGSPSASSIDSTCRGQWRNREWGQR
ncbi:MAG TPA: hypothetical protein VEI95_16610 [Acidobacteriota bacterium]|nr:hypothetical protein [Acidobacteriota bacterium]